MPVLFTSQPGHVIGLESTGIVPLGITVDGFPQYPAILASITQISFRTAALFQMSPSMRNFMHVYTFGEKAGQFMVSGVAFAASCQGSGASGIESVDSWYNDNRLTRTGKAINLQVGLTGKMRKRGILVDFNIQTVDPVFQLSQFTFLFATFSPDSARAPILIAGGSDGVGGDGGSNGIGDGGGPVFA